MVGSPYVVKCHVCRRRKVKCLKTNLTCTGYERRLRWDAPKTVLAEPPAVANVKKRPSSSRNQHGGPDQGDCEDLQRSRLSQTRPKRSQRTANRYSIHFDTQADLSASQHRLAIIGVLQLRWIPTLKQAGGSRGTHICSTWVLSACTLSVLKEAGPLSNSLLAISLILLSSGEADKRLLIEGVRHYSKAVQGLKKLVDHELRHDVTEQTRDISLLTCFTCASFEMMANRSLGTAYQHFGGMKAIFQQGGIGGLTSQLSRSILYEYRPIDICFCLLGRRASFLSRRPWLNLHYILQDDQAAGPMQRLLDIAYLVPPIMEQFDSVCAQRLDDDRIDSEPILQIRKRSITQKLLRLLCSLHSVWHELQIWEAGLQNHDEAVLLYISKLSSWSNASRDPDESLRGKIFAVTYTFPSFELAGALIYKAAVEIFVLELMADLKQHVVDRSGEISGSATASPTTTSEADFVMERKATGILAEDILSRDSGDLQQMSLDAARRICSALEYFFGQDKKMTGRLVALFPFETAYRTFKKHSCADDGNGCRRELLFCDMVAEQLQREGVPTNFQSSST